MPRVLIFGAGSVGTVYASILDKANADITCICRSNLEAARSQGFTVRSSILGEHSFFPSVAASTEGLLDHAETPPFDFVVVSIKATDDSIRDSSESLRQAISIGHTCIVVIQNGIGMEQYYHEAFPKNTIISGVTYLPTSQISPTVFLHTETQVLHLGIFPAASASETNNQNIESFTSLIKAGGGQATVHKDVQIERWKKLIGNATWNPICALSRCRDLEFLQASKMASDFVVKAMQEVVAVAEIMGHGEHIQASAVEDQIKRSAVRPWPGVEPSMMSDMRNSRSMEVNVIIGQVVKLAKEKSVDVPRLETLYVLLKGLDWSLQQKRL